MNLKALAFTVLGAAVALFYALECLLTFQAKGLTAPLATKLLVLGVAAYFCVRNAKRIKKSGVSGTSEGTGAAG